MTVLAFIFIVPEKRREKPNAFGKFLHDTCNFKYLVVEKLLQALYIFATGDNIISTTNTVKFRGCKKLASYIPFAERGHCH